MGTSLNGLTPQNTYPALIKVGDNSALNATLKVLSDGVGTNLPMSASTTIINVTGTLQLGSGIIPTNIDFASNPTSATTAVGAIRTYADGVSLSEAVAVLRNGNVGVNQTAPTAKLQIKGSGSTSATTALLVQNSAGAELLKINNDNGAGFGAATPLLNRARFGTYVQIKYDTPAIDVYQGGSGIGLLITNAGALLAEFNDAAGGGAIIRHSLNIGSASYASASAVLQADSTTKGFLPPRMTTTQKNAIATPAAGLMIYDSTLNKLCVYTTAWETITSI